MVDNTDLQGELPGMKLGVSDLLLVLMGGRVLVTRMENRVDTLHKFRSLEPVHQCL